MTEVFDLAAESAEAAYKKEKTLDELAFLPAPKTWIEWQYACGAREGVLLEQIDEDIAAATWAYMGDDLFLTSKQIGYLRLNGRGTIHSDHFCPLVLVEQSQGEAVGRIVHLYAILAIINTPRVIGRRQHMPHRGLERRLLSMRRTIGAFPMRAWTEIMLHVTPPTRVVEEGIYEAHLTGERARHFVRAHMRIRLGRLEFVSAHWRGNEALGIKQSRYKLVA